MTPKTSALLRYVLLPAIAIALVLSSSAQTAQADRVDSLIAKLRSGSAKKRLSAALSLTNTGSKRAIGPFIKALRDSDRTVRGVAATALRKLVNGSVPASLRTRAIKSLKRVAKKDSSAFVRIQAKKAYKTLESMASGGSKVFVDIGPMGDKTGGGKTWKRVMRKAALKALARTGWKTSGKMSARTLKRKKMDAFHIRGTLIKLDTSGSTVACKVSMLLATYPAKSMFGFLNGGARVPTGGSAKEKKFASRDCVEAVIGSLARKIIGTIKSRI